MAMMFAMAGLLGLSAPAVAQDPDEPIRAAREAFAKRDRSRLASLRASGVR